MKILLGTKNRGKISEILSIFSDIGGIEWLTFDEHPFRDVIEDGASFRENALKKAHQIAQETGLAVLAEDSGLEVKALHGAPGIRSARFAGADATDKENIRKLLELLRNSDEREAQFVCVAVLVTPSGQEFVTSGSLSGQIALEPRGHNGFGYDPVFIPTGFNKTLSQLGSEVKNGISHRRRALEELRRIIITLARK